MGIGGSRIIIVQLPSGWAARSNLTAEVLQPPSVAFPVVATWSSRRSLLALRLQIPIPQNTLSVSIEIRGFATPRTQQPWEKGSISLHGGVPPATGCPMTGPPSRELTEAICRVPST